MGPSGTFGGRFTFLTQRVLMAAISIRTREIAQVCVCNRLVHLSSVIYFVRVINKFYMYLSLCSVNLYNLQVSY
jgi:hypothetical protein